MDSVFQLLTEKTRSVAELLGLTEPTSAQVLAIPRVLEGQNLLIIAPTGSGKTEAALLAILDQIAKYPQRHKGISLLYITPLRALNRDMLKRLMLWCQSLEISVEVRHGDTPPKRKREQSSRPPQILVTTPETLQAILAGSKMRRHLSHLKWVIVDEVHNLAESRRGAQLSIALERLLIAGARFQRIGLSATVGNPEEIGKFLVGSERNIEIVNALQEGKKVDYRVEMPKAEEEDYILARSLYTAPEVVSRLNRIIDLSRGHKSTLLFVNSRTHAESLGLRLGMLRAKVGVHHGSLPREERTKVENEFKSGSLPLLVCTSTLELGIDIGSADLSLQYMSPRQVTALIQRVGRSGHSLSKVSEGIILAVSPDDVLESQAVITLAKQREVEPTAVHYNSLDVLAHQVVGLTLDFPGGLTFSELMEIVRKAGAYSSLKEQDLRNVVDFLIKLRYVREQESKLFRTFRGRDYYYQNLSMIPDERRYKVVDLTTQQPIGILGEEFMMLHARKGVNFIIKGKVWRIESITEDGIVYVLPVEDPTAAVPGWEGEMLPLPKQVAVQVGRLREQIKEMLENKTEAEVIGLLNEVWDCEKAGREKVVEQISEHIRSGAPLPSHKSLLIEGYDRFLIIHSCYGDRVNNTLGELFEEVLMRKGFVRRWHSDGYRILIELTVNTIDFDLDVIRRQLFGFTSESVTPFLKGIIRKHFPFGYYMKFVAERFGALKRGIMMGGEGQKELGIKFRLTPIYDETLREALMLHVDLDTVGWLMDEVSSGRIKVEVFKSLERPSSLAYPILNKYVEDLEFTLPTSVERSNLERMKDALENEIVNLLCMNCGRLAEYIKVKELVNRPLCGGCRSGLLAVTFWSSRLAEQVLQKKLSHEKLTDEEQKVLARTRRSADLVLSYGKRAVVAQCVYGVGPQTASKILAKMHDEESDFYKDLLQAKMSFITTRPFWDKR
jgi:ATP-dependent Lhr-like helicase